MGGIYTTLQEAKDAFYDRNKANNNGWTLCTSQSINNHGLGTRYIEVYTVVHKGEAVAKVIEYLKTEKGWRIY